MSTPTSQNRHTKRRRTAKTHEESPPSKTRHCHLDKRPSPASTIPTPPAETRPRTPPRHIKLILLVIPIRIPPPPPHPTRRRRISQIAPLRRTRPHYLRRRRLRPARHLPLVAVPPVLVVAFRNPFAGVPVHQPQALFLRRAGVRSAAAHETQRTPAYGPVLVVGRREGCGARAGPAAREHVVEGELPLAFGS